MPYVRNTSRWKPVLGLLNGGLDLAACAAFGGTTAWFVEFDDAPSRILAHHWPHVPNLGDVTTVDWSAVEPVDVLTGGFPCQDVSAAGRRAGLADGTRSGLWSHMAEAINQLRPSWVVIENVKGLLSAAAHRPMESEPDGLGDRDPQPVLRALGAVLGDLADLGYDAQWVTVAAADVGAPHRRERVFILAHPQDAADPDGAGSETRRGESRPGERRRLEPVDGSNPSTTDPKGDGRDEGRAESARLVGRHDAAVGGMPPGRVNAAGLCPTCAAALRDRLGSWQCPDPNVCGDDDDVDLLPTPSVADGAGGHLTRSGDRSGELLLPGVARAHATGQLLPTPEAKLANSGPDFARAGRDGSGGDDLITTAARAEQAQSWGKYASAIARAEQYIGRPAPSPTEPNRNGKPRLAAEFAEWMMMLPAGHVTDPAIGLSRSDQLKAIGNGVCPPQAYHAIRQLLAIARSC